MARPSIARVLGGCFAVLVGAAMLVLVAHSTFGFGAPRFSYFIEEWVYDFITLTAAVLTLARAALHREARLAWGLLGRCAGSQFDPRVAEELERVVRGAAVEAPSVAEAVR